MKKKVFALLLCGLPLMINAQDAFDVLQMSQTELRGTSRFQSMAGAFGALGGDLSVLTQNPGGIGVYRSSDLGITLSLDFNNTKAGVDKMNQTNFNVNNVGYIFTHADSIPNKEIIENFEKYNKLEYYEHPFYATTLLHNNFKPDGIRVGIGIFGIVIPTVNFNDFLFRIGPMHKGYNQKILQRTVIKGSSSFADNPELGL
jgi:hypothetical protein